MSDNLSARVTLLNCQARLTFAEEQVCVLQRDNAVLQRENARLLESNAALARLLCEAYQEIADLTPEPTARPQLTLLPGGGSDR